jgi:hypothetical protein
MIPADEREMIAQTAPPPKHALTRIHQEIAARLASAYTRAGEWVAESLEVIRRAGREAVIHLQPFTMTIVGRLIDPLMWLRFAALLCMLMGGLLRLAEPDTWLGHPFASRYEAGKAGYRTLLHVTGVEVGEDRRERRITRLTRNNPGFHEILELALANNQDLRDYFATEQIGPIETIYAPAVRDGVRIGAGFYWRSTAERMFSAPVPIRLEDREGKRVAVILDYTEAELKARFFMPRLRWWAVLAVWAGFIINVLLLPFPSSRKPPQPTREA